MGKSSKKSIPKVDAASVPVPQLTKSSNTAKREAGEAVDKVVSVKKQKIKEDEAVFVKQIAETKNHKKKKDQAGSSEDSSSSGSDYEPKVKALSKKGVTSVRAVPQSSIDDSSSDDEPTTKATALSKKQPASTKEGKKGTSSESPENDSGDAPAKSTGSLKRPWSDVGARGQNKMETSEDESDKESSEGSDPSEPQTKKLKPVIAANPGKPSAKASHKDSSSPEESAEESSDDEPSKSLRTRKQPLHGSEKGEDEDSDESSSDKVTDEKIEDEEQSKAPKKKATDVEMVDASMLPKTDTSQMSSEKAPKIPATPQVQSASSKKLFVGNLAFSIVKADVENFFKDTGEIVDVRLVSSDNGRFRGFGFVEFATAEAAQRALELHDQILLGRAVKLDLTNEPHSKESNSNQKCGRFHRRKIKVKGFDISLGEDEITSALKEHFGSCGEVKKVSIPKDTVTGSIKGSAYLYFKDRDGRNSALKLNRSELGGYSLVVKKAKLRGDGGKRSGRGGGEMCGGKGGERVSSDRHGGGRGGGNSALKLNRSELGGCSLVVKKAKLRGDGGSGTGGGEMCGGKDGGIVSSDRHGGGRGGGRGGWGTPNNRDFGAVGKGELKKFWRDFLSS